MGADHGTNVRVARRAGKPASGARLHMPVKAETGSANHAPVPAPGRAQPTNLASPPVTAVPDTEDPIARVVRDQQ